MLEQTLAILGPEASAYNVVIEARLSEDYVVQGNHMQIAQALVNLIRNAISALASTDSKNRSIFVEATGHDGRVVISVEDNGPGFPDFIKPFAAFETTSADGLGLGLSICKSLVEANKGTITHAQGAMAGARFEIALPGGRKSKGTS